MTNNEGCDGLPLDNGKNKEQLIRWAKNINQAGLPDWDGLPDMDLYMDQVVTYLEKQLEICKGPYDEKIITSSMINNYVKHGTIPPTTKKKYSQRHLAALIGTCVLKQVLPISTIGQIIQSEDVAKAKQQMYNDFAKRQNESVCDDVGEFVEKIESFDPDDRAKFIDYAAELAVKSSIQRTLSLRILSELFGGQDEKRSRKAGK